MVFLIQTKKADSIQEDELRKGACHVMKILLAGDSTVAHYGPEAKPMSGWGEGLEFALQESGSDVRVLNFAKPGASTKTFRDEGLWNDLLNEIDDQDLVIIQFGHNDQKVDSGVQAKDFYLNLKRMIHDVIEKNGVPILCTPVERRNIVGESFKKSLNQERHLMKKLAQQEQVYLIDLNDYSYFIYQSSTSIEQTKEYVCWFKEGQEKNYPEGIEDNTHLSIYGARTFGRFVHMRLRPFLQEGKMFDDYYYGACMYPEVWSEKILREDIKHMKEIGMNFARIGEFIWSTLEPEEGQIDLSFLRRTLEIYQAEGIKVVLCIPTPTPPIWMTKDHPERCIHNRDGSVMVHGSRQHACTNNAYFRKKSYELTREIAKMATEFDHIIGIQLDNEFKCHVDLCYCDTCSSMWTNWLTEEYKEVSQLNKAWGTRIWSEEYLAFGDVPTPTITPFLHNSSLMNAFRKFTAETLNDFARGLTHMIRMETDIPITHNSAMGFNLLNEELFHDLDFAGFDTYAPAKMHPSYTINLDVWRNMKKNVKEYMLLETSTSHAGHIENYISPHPAGYLPTEIFSGFAAGMTAFCYWHFRAHRYGVEQPHSTVLTPWGEPGSGHDDVVKGGRLIEQMKPFLQETEYKDSSIAYLYSDEARRHYNIESGGMYTYRELVTAYYTSLIRRGLSVEVVQETADFAPYKLVIVPFMRHLSGKLLEKLQDFVSQGGKVIVGPMTADRNEELALNETNGFGDLGEWLGLSEMLQITVHDQQFLVSDQTHEEELDRLVTTFKAPKEWETILTIEDGRTVAAKGEFGSGTVLNLGALPRDLDNSPLWTQFVDREIRPYDTDQNLIKVSSDLVKYRRESEQVTQFYLVNMTKTPQTLELKRDYIDRLSGEAYPTGSYELASYEYLILETEKES